MAEYTIELPEPEREVSGRTSFPGCVTVYGTAFVAVAGQHMWSADELRRKAASMLAAAEILERGK